MVTSSEGATCQVHGQEATTVCARCGSFMCARCPRGRFCAVCASRIGDGMTGAVVAPAVALAFVGVSSLLFQLLIFVGPTFGVGTPIDGPDRSEPSFQFGYYATLWAFQLLGPASSLVTLLGGIQMARGHGYRLAVTGSILSLLPFCNLCLGFSTLVGIWALVVLTRPSVKAVFEARAAPG